MSYLTNNRPDFFGQIHLELSLTALSVWQMMLHAFCPLHHWTYVIPGIRWGCWSYISCTRSQVVFIWKKNICLSSEMLSYDVGIVPVGVLDLGWLETRGVSILKHQCASAPRTSGTCRLFLKADLSLKKKKRQFYSWCMTLLPIIQDHNNSVVNIRLFFYCCKLIPSSYD